MARFTKEDKEHRHTYVLDLTPDSIEYCLSGAQAVKQACVGSVQPYHSQCHRACDKQRHGLTITNSQTFVARLEDNWRKHLCVRIGMNAPPVVEKGLFNPFRQGKWKAYIFRFRVWRRKLPQETMKRFSEVTKLVPIYSS